MKIRGLLRKDPQKYIPSVKIDPSREFSALYFPCEVEEASDERNFYQTLKSALLFFDRVYVIVPEFVLSDYFSYWADYSKIDDGVIAGTERIQTIEFKLWRERFKRIRRFIQHTKILQDNELLLCVNPNTNMLGYQLRAVHNSFSEDTTAIPAEKAEDFSADILFYSTVSDLNDTTFRQLVAEDFPYRTPGFYLFKDQGEFNWLGSICRYSSYEEDKIENSGTGLIPAFETIVSPVVGMAVIMAHIVSFCMEYPVYPITDNPYYWKLLRRKFKRVADMPELKRFKTDTKLRISALGLELMNLELPRLAARSFDDVLYIRKKYAAQLTRFRTELASFANFAANQLWSEEFFEQCSEIVALRIIPAITELQRALTLSKDKVLVNAFKSARNLTPAIPLVSVLLPGFPILYALALAAGLFSIEVFLDLYFEEKKIKAGCGLSYLLDLKNKT
jgi:hypothetical protein